MKNNNFNTEDWQLNNHSEKGRIMGGIIIIGAGIVFLLKALGVLLPSWLFTWQMLIIVIGLYSGAKKGFRTTGWLIPVAIGAFFLFNDFYGWPLKHFFWPLLLIIIGTVMIIKPKRKKHLNTYSTSHYKNTCENPVDPIYSSEEHIEVNCIFGGTKRAIITKSFKGGQINAIFGGAEIDFSQTDFNDIVEIEINAIFGGVKIIVPPHWKIITESTVILGGVDDKRVVDGMQQSENKKLVIKGIATFGGIEIKSY